MGWRVDSELQQMLRESAKGYLGDKGGPAHFRAVRESGAGFDAAAWTAMAELGWPGILLPEAAGGSELGLEPALTLAEELGQAIAPEPFVASGVIAATLLAASTTPRAAELAGALAAGRGGVTLAWQERTGVIGLPAFETRLADGKLSGRKVHVPAWHPDAVLLVAAMRDDGPVVAAVAPDADGVSVVTTAMTDATVSADIDFADIAIGADDILLAGDASRVALELALARGTVALSAQLEGLASALWHRTADYLRQRVQFDQPLADFQALRHRMVDLYAGIELAAASWRAAAKALEAGVVEGVALHAAKARCSDVALEMGRWAIQYHGAFGFTDEADVGLYVHTALRWSSWLGNAPAHRRAALMAHRRSGHGAASAKGHF